MKVCKCEDWEEQVKIIDNALTFIQTTRSYLMDFSNLKPFNYCAWCGKELVEK